MSRPEDVAHDDLRYAGLGNLWWRGNLSMVERSASRRRCGRFLGRNAAKRTRLR